MKKRTRSLLDELNAVHGERDNDLLIQTTANNIIESSINFLSRIHNYYDVETAAELERKFLNSIRTGDPRKFTRNMKKIVEGKKNDTE